MDIYNVLGWGLKRMFPPSTFKFIMKMAEIGEICLTKVNERSVNEKLGRIKKEISSQVTDWPDTRNTISTNVPRDCSAA